MIVTNSIKTRLLIAITLPIIFSFIVVGFISYHLAYHEADEVYDAKLVHFSKIIFTVFQSEITQLDNKKTVVAPKKTLHEYEKFYCYRIWKNKELLSTSENSEVLTDLTDATGFFYKEHQNDSWRVLVLEAPPFTVAVAEQKTVRDDMVSRIIGSIILPEIFVIPFFCFLIWVGILYGLNPIMALSRHILNRDPNNLQTIDKTIVPKELEPLVNSLNDLFKRTSTVIESEKNFSNYAAHELKTPLAAIITQLQVANRTKDLEKAKHLVEDTLPAAKRMQAIIEQLLMFIRAQNTASHLIQVNLSDICQNVITYFSTFFLEKNITVDCQIAPKRKIQGNIEMLEVMFSNLISNAIKFSPTEGIIYISLEEKNNQTVFSVIDEGIGISKQDKTRVFNNFYRTNSEEQYSGCGLGLSIVRLIANSHHATVSIKDGQNGVGSHFSVIFQ